MEPPTEYPCPSWDEIKEGKGKYWKRSGGFHPVHTDLWDSSLNPEFQLSLDKEVVKILKSKPGPKSKYAKSRGVGRRKSGMAYAIRRESCQLLVQYQDWVWWKKRLEEYPDKLKPNSTQRITFHSLDLSVAIAEFVRKLKKETGIHNHSRLKKGWRSQLSRLIEIRVRHYQNRKKGGDEEFLEEEEIFDEEENRGGFYEQEVGSDAWSRGDSGSESTR